MILVWTWYRRRCVEHFDDYLRAVSAAEIEAWQTCRRGGLNDTERQNLQVQLVELEIEALEKHRSGVFTDEQQLATFLGRVEHARQLIGDIARLGCGDRGVAVANDQRKAA
jgi:hypothetical protein